MQWTSVQAFRLPPLGELFGRKFPSTQQSLLLRENIVIFIVQDGVVAYDARSWLPRGGTLNIARSCFD
ncbi:hypothetical protein OKW38_002802 [Paraburkholderia sp. MM5496-R1]|uniref:hypothetical protein n=1 Tax=Paraburkholderia sp. MM5496-R1 TaxID=2991065 RepID=UPI003D1DDFF3